MRILVEKKNNNVVQLYRRKIGDGFTTLKSFGKDETFGPDAVIAAKKWAKKKGYKARLFKNGVDYPFIIMDNDTKMVKPDLAKKINELGRRRKRYVWMGEGWRTNAQQWAFWNAYVARGKRPPTVAYPGTSNHESGNAADISVFLTGPQNSYTNVGNDGRTRSIMRALNLCLPVPGEAWHTQIGNDWRA